MTPQVDTRSLGDYVGSPMYAVFGEHEMAVLFALLVGGGAWLVRWRARRGAPWATAFVEPYRLLAVPQRFVFWLLTVAGAVHMGLVLGHEPSGYTIGFGFLGVVQLHTAYRLLQGGLWRLRAGLILTASLVGYAATVAGGDAPDQTGLATKLVELTALAAVLRPAAGTQRRQLLSSAAVVGLAVVVSFSAWAGAFTLGEGGHHVGEAAEPGTLIPEGADRPPTPAEAAAADELYEATVAAVAKYEDVRVAAADGYEVGTVRGSDHHAANPEYQNDGRILDPERPENLIYAATDTGPVLVGVMFEQEGIGVPGPAVGGPLTVWHAHDHVCFSLTPVALAGLTSPFGVCPAGSVTIPITNEMIHVWTLPGAPDRFGHLEDEWLEEYLAGV